MPSFTVEEYISAASQRHGVPIGIAMAVAEQESGFNQDARGDSGEIGVYQIMPGTAAELGIDPYNLGENVDGGVRYLAGQYERFGNWEDALAAYNAGASRVIGGTVPSSTLEYIKSIFARAGEGTRLATVGVPGFTQPTFSTTVWGGGGFPWWVVVVGGGILAGKLLQRKR